MDQIKQLVAQATPAMIEMRRDLHRHPELGYQEHRTAALVEQSLAALDGVAVTRVTGTGVVGVLTGSLPGPVLLLRADLDALPIEEETGLPFASEVKGVMHACGHDGHTAILVAAAKILAEKRSNLPGTIKFIFEPNEEEVGALAMIEAGVMENPKVTAAASLHLWAQLPLGRISVEEGVTWAGMDHFTIKVRGRGGHTGSPHTAIDPILVAAHIVTGLQVLQSRELDPFLSSSLVFGRITGGRAANIIPSEVELEGTIRYLFDGRDDGPYKPRIRLRQIAQDLARTYRAEAEVDFYCSQPPMSNNPRMTALGRAAAAATTGPESLQKFLNMGGEDFSEFSARVPAVMAMIGAGSQKAGAVYPHHNSKFAIDEEALSIGLEWLLRTTLSYLNSSYLE
ncbi:MAG: amidohydrolase [Deltaproteobacteria bacterium]|jgi:amidohydrolase|nr:amidohydrolase [Deltaproteobacteria bacterium]